MNVALTSFNSYFACLVSALFMFERSMSTQHLTILLRKVYRNWYRHSQRYMPRCLAREIING